MLLRMGLVNARHLYIGELPLYRKEGTNRRRRRV